MIGIEFNPVLIRRWVCQAMPSPDFDRLRVRLLRSGVAPQHVVRAISELRDHVEDIESEAVEFGLPQDAARVQANERIGAIDSIAIQYLNKPKLKCWVYRHARTARVVLPIAYVMLLPALPILVAIEYAPSIKKWCACLILSAFVTAAMLLVMQLSIAIT